MSPLKRYVGLTLGLSRGVVMSVPSLVLWPSVAFGNPTTECTSCHGFRVDGRWHTPSQLSSAFQGVGGR